MPNITIIGTPSEIAVLSLLYAPAWVLTAMYSLKAAAAYLVFALQLFAVFLVISALVLP